MTEQLAILQELILAAKADGDDETAEWLASIADDPEQVAQVVCELTESVEDVFCDRILMERFSGTITDKSGRKITYQDGKRVAGQHDYGSGNDPASHADIEQSAKSDIEKLPPEQQKKVKGIVGKMGDKINQFLVDHATAFSRLATAASVIESFITTPEDIQKSPWLASKFAGGQTAGDHIADWTTSGLGVGIPGTVVTKVVAAAMAHAWKGVKKQIGLSESAGVDYDAAGEFLAGLLDTIYEAMGLPTGADAKSIAEKLKGLSS